LTIGCKYHQAIGVGSKQEVAIRLDKIRPVNGELDLIAYYS
jgi:hypothetical protein